MKLAIVIMCFALCAGCTSAEWSKVSSYGNEHTVEMYSGGQLVRSWTSTGKVLSETNSDGYYFTDKETGRLIEVSGDVVITRLE